MPHSAVRIIERKRDGQQLDPEEIRWLVAAYCRDEVPDYQMSAFAMAVYFSGMTGRETAAMTLAMADSGRRLTYPANSPPKVDKHSTGGVGDKISLVLAPLLACDDVWVPMISGRGLGITGGTLDKLESIPGFNVNLSPEQTIDQLSRIRVAMVGQTPDICPADRKLYALRDVTATVPSQPLIVSSIMSKKIAESLDALVLDVKFGSGAFMKNRADAQSLADGLAAVASEIGLAFHYQLSPMDQPLGRAVGNALEVQEALDVLQGNGPRDVRELTLDLAAAVALKDRQTLASWLDDGTALEKFHELVSAQSGDLTALDQPAPVIRDIPASTTATVSHVDARKVAEASLDLGAGRKKTTDTVDHTVGFDQLVKSGEAVEPGTPLARVHARTESAADAATDAIRAAVTLA